MAMINCPECGKEISDKAPACPNCGHPLKKADPVKSGPAQSAKKPKKKGSCIGGLIIVVAVIIVIAVVGGGDKKAKKVDSTKEGVPTENTDQTAKEDTIEKESFSVGETAELNDIQISLVAVEESDGSDFIVPDEGNIFVICEFEISNNSSKDITVSSIANFEAYCDSYAINQDILGLQLKEGKGQLDGSVASGKKMNGIISYQVPNNWSELEINVSPDFWSSKDIKFIATK
ncbi:DUF4352 domain-containing protein [Ruminococcus gauvreauii]|uniref:DUF4352 domain-containing protein n=1 Tax=Ruminococcus gauvreauii TaxID=438033 RepID=UPI003983FBF2